MSLFKADNTQAIHHCSNFLPLKKPLRMRLFSHLQQAIPPKIRTTDGEVRTVLQETSPHHPEARNSTTQTHTAMTESRFIISSQRMPIDIMKTNFPAILSCIALLALSGCALTTDHIQLGYEQQKNVSLMSGAENITVRVLVNDLRPDKSKVSSKKNGYGMEMAPIIPLEKVDLTIRRAIELELQSRGFQLADNSTVLQIAADLSRFHNDHKTGFFAGNAVADLHMAVTVRSKDKRTLYFKNIIAQGIEPNTQLHSGENARLALNRALENGIKSLFEDSNFLSALIASAETGTRPKSQDNAPPF